MRVEKTPLNVCRICLRKETKNNMKSIHIRDEKQLLISRKIEQCGGIKIEKNDGLPTNICFRCNEILGIAHKFRTICKNSDNYLQVFVRNSKTNIAPTSILRDDYKNETEENAQYELFNYSDGNEEEYFYTDGNSDEEIEKSIAIKKAEDEVEMSSNEPTNSTPVSKKQVQEIQKGSASDDDIIKDLLISGFGYEIVDNETTTETNKSTIAFEQTFSKEAGLQKQKDGSEKLKLDQSEKHQISPSSPIKRKRGRPRKFNSLHSSDSKVEKSKIMTKATRDRKSITVKEEEGEEEDISINSRQVHICEICGNIYERKYCLEAHMRRHRGEKPFECEICKKSFALNFQLTRHMRSHTGQRPYKCKYCDRRFSDRSTNVKHERIHTNERPYQCDTCGKSFTYSNVLKVHKMIHTGEKPYTCELCGKGFSQLHHLRAHLQIQLHKNDPRVKDILLKTDNEAKEIEIKQELSEEQGAILSI